MKKTAILLIAALLLLTVCAHADVAKGDRGEEVRYLQWLLQKTGWLADNPDGSFGNRTEQAVLDSQAALGLEATGVADADLMRLLDRERVRQDKLAHGQDYYEPYPGNFAPPFETNYRLPFHCSTTVLRGVVCRDSCERHLALLEQEYDLTFEGMAEGCAEAARLWREDVEAQFAEWVLSADGDAAAIEAARTAWLDFLDLRYAAVQAACDDPVAVERQNLLAVKCLAETLCELRSGEMPVNPGSGMMIPEGSVAPDAACRAWSINGSTEFFTGCAEHAPLFDRESAWSAAGTSDAAGLSALSGAWDDSLAALFEQWAIRGSEEAAAVRAAQERLDSAVSTLCAATPGENLSALLHLRLVQLECARLCEFLNRA